MLSRNFVHLHCHSHYSLLDGAGSIDRLVERAKSQGMNALALTDHGNLHGALEFYKKAKAAGINPIIGYEAYIAPGSRFDKSAGRMKDASYHLTLLAQNRTGFKNLLKMASAAFLEGFYFKPRIDKELLEAHHEGIICLSGCVSSEFSRAVLRGMGDERDLEEAKEVAHWFRNLFGERYFVEVMNNNIEIQRQALQGAIDVANQLGLPMVATCDTHYVAPEDAEAQDVMLCINTGKFRTDTSRMKMDGQEYYLKSADEMYEAFGGMEDVVARSQEIADTVDLDLELGKRHFPTYDVPAGQTAEQFLRELCLQGLRERYADNPEMCRDGELQPVVMERLDRELGVINKLGFPNYFLICWDFVREARRQGVPATARGSGVGALVCYALYLSHVCPIRYGLLFERFLDENRLEAPDIDIDFCKERRADIMRYVKEKYGAANVAQIGTFGTLAARAAIKDVGRALGIPLMRVNQVTAMVPEQLGISLAKALETSDDLRQTYETDGEIRELLDLAMKIEGLARNVGTHAAAVVIADQPLTEYVPLGRVTGKEDIITQWSMNDVEAAGLLKMDFLGLRNLTILRKAVDLIEQTTGQRLDLQKLPLDDAETFALLCRGETKGVFQLESGGIRDLLQKMKPDHFRDIIATNALYRPGPLEGGMVRDYVEVKHGRQEAEYKHPVLKDILEETNGVMVYQEQVMQILNRLGDIPLAAAYTCIKAISKKKQAIIDQNREQFIKGATSRGLTEKEAVEFWEMIAKFAGYGFNKCVVGETTIMDARQGRRTTIKELFDSGLCPDGEPFTIHALGEDGRLRPRPVRDVVWNGRRPVFRLTTRQGRQLTATANHPLRTPDGWKNLGQLEQGERIAAPRCLRVAADATWPAHQLIVLAALLSEGSTFHASRLYFDDSRRRLVDDFCRSVELFPETKVRVQERCGGRFEVCVSRGREPELQPENRPREAAIRTPRTLGDSWLADQDADTREARTATAVAEYPAGDERSGAWHWAAELGIVGRRAAEKRVPAEVFQLADDNLELLLGRLWASDGFFGDAGRLPCYATSSGALAEDVRLLLLRLGIVSRIENKTSRCEEQGADDVPQRFTVHLLGEGSAERFLDRVAPHALGCEEQLNRFRQQIRELPACRSRTDTIPAETRSSVDASDIWWDTVESIEAIGVRDTYDLEVEDDHNFVADGLVVHNSHSTAYALIAYQTAYLKAHYPVEFMAALLSGDIPGRNFKTKDSLVEHLEDCARMNVEVVPPDVNRSDADFTVEDGKIHFGLSAIKGCGGGAAEAIAASRRRDGAFRDLFDFCERVDAGACNRATIETLVKAGAFDSFGARRAQLLAVVDRALQSGASALADRRSGQKSLFGELEEEEQQVPAKDLLPDMPELEERERLLMEKEVLGFYLSSHPLAEYEKTLNTYCSHSTSTLGGLPDRSEVVLGGMLSAIKLAHTKNSRPGVPSKYANFDLEDMAGSIRCILWPDGFQQYGEMVKADAILVVRGNLDYRGGDEPNLIVDELIPLDELDSRYTSGIKIRIVQQEQDEDVLKKVREILRGYPGKCELQFVFWLNSGQRVHMRAEGMRVAVTPELRERLDDLLGPGNYQLMTSPVQGNGKSGPPRRKPARSRG